MKDLKGKTNFPKVPSDKQIDSTFAGWLKKVQLDAKQQLKLKALPHKYKFRLCWRHDERVKKLQEEDEKKQQAIQEVNKIVDKVMTQANSVNLSSMLRCLQQQELLNVRVKQLLTRGTIQHLVNTLMKLEMISRQHKGTRDSITIIKIFDSLMGEQTAVSAMRDTPMFFKVVFSIFHPIEPEITGQMLSLIGSRKGFCWQSEDSIKLILEAMNQFKIEYKLSNRFDIVVRTIYHSKNIVMIYHLLTFLLHFLLSFEDKTLNTQVLLELQETIVHGKKIDEVFKQIKLRVKQGKYQIASSTYDSVRISLNTFVHPLANNGVTNLEMFDDSGPLKSISIETIQQSNMPDNFQEEIKTKYYLETHETQMFEEIQKQVMELVDAIMNIDQILDLIEQQDLEEIDDDKEAAQHSVFYMDIESSKNHSFGELCASDSELGGTTTFRASQEHYRHSKILNDDKLLDEIKILEDKNAVIIQNYDDAQTQLHELQLRITKIENQYQLKSQEQQTIYDEQIIKMKQEIIVLEQQIELLTQQLNQLQSEQPAAVGSQVPEIPQEIVIDEVDDISVSRHASNSSSDVVIPKLIESHVVALDIIEQLIDDVQTPVQTQVQLELVNPLEDDDIIVVQSTEIGPLQQVEQIPIMVPRTITSIRVTITNDTSTQTESKVYLEQFQQTDVIEPPQQLQPTPSVSPPPPPPPPLVILPPPPPPPPLLQKQSQSMPPLPPPPPPMKGHAPPPPPPPMKGSAPPPPPPPKGSNLMAQTVRPTSNFPTKQLPQVPMKPLNWVLVNQQNIKSTIFTFLDDKQPILNVDFLEQHFNKPKLEKKDVVKSAQTLQLKVLLLNPERSKNIELVLGKLKLPYQLIAKALLSFDTTVLTQSTLDSLDSICPTEEEVKLIAEYPDDRMNFGNSEQFVDAIRQVNGYQNRIKGLRFSNTINECVNDLMKKCRQLSQAFMKLPTMKEIQVLFMVTLAIGNFMNAQSSKGNAFGFKLDIIEKSADVKSIDNSTTLLYHIIEQSELILQKGIITENDISEIEIISKLPVSQLTVDLSELKKGQQILKKAIDCWTNEESDKVVVKLQPHLVKVTETIVEIETNIANLESEYQKCAVYFCENPKDASDKLGDKVIRLFRQIIKTKTEQKQKDDRKKKLEEQKQKEQDRLAKSQQLSSNTLLPPQTIKPIPPKGADPKQFQMNQNELLKQLSKRQNQGQQNSFINNEIKELQKIKQKRGSILFQQL